MNNTPVYGCEGCRTTGGRMSCFIHGQFEYHFDFTIKQDSPIYHNCPKHGQYCCPECLDIEASSIASQRSKLKGK
jgi:hypothetical protein